VRPSEALQKYQHRIKQTVLARKACNPRVFGSVLAGDDSPGSDLDLLVDPMPGATLFDLGGLQVDLEEILGVPVDVLTPDDLPETFRQKVVQEARKL
jgi:predicted nucleotidyltransferase